MAALASARGIAGCRAAAAANTGLRLQTESKCGHQFAYDELRVVCLLATHLHLKVPLNASHSLAGSISGLDRTRRAARRCWVLAPSVAAAATAAAAADAASDAGDRVLLSCAVGGPTACVYVHVSVPGCFKYRDQLHPSLCVLCALRRVLFYRRAMRDDQ